MDGVMHNCITPAGSKYELSWREDDIDTSVVEKWDTLKLLLKIKFWTGVDGNLYFIDGLRMFTRKARRMQEWYGRRQASVLS